MQETMHKGIYADREGNIFSTKQGTLRQLKPQKVNNSRSRNQYWMIASYGLVHRLVASAYLGSVEGKVINHLDGNPSNNAVSNLEIVTQRENYAHALQSGLVSLGQSHHKAKYSDSELLEALREIKQGASVKSTAAKFGITQSYLNKVKNQQYRAYLWGSLG